VITLLPSQKKVYRKGGTMRLGAYPIILSKDSQIYKYYGKERVYERFRHRFEVNPEYITILESDGFCFSGLSEDGSVVHVGELPNKKFFVGTQYHPEFLSRFENPSPLFVNLVRASFEKQRSRNNE
jgi:CTP synthase